MDTITTIMQCTVIVYITYYYNEIQCNKLYPKTIKYKWQGPDLGAHSKFTKIKDSENGTEIGASKIFGGNYLSFQI